MRIIKSFKTTKNNMVVEVNIYQENFFPSTKVTLFCELTVDNKTLLYSKPISAETKRWMENAGTASFAISQLSEQGKIKKDDKRIFDFFKHLFYKL